MNAAAVLPPRVRAIVRQVARDHALPVGDVLGVPRRKALARARWEIWATLRAQRPQPSLPRIGLWFGVDHTTVRYGVRRFHGLEGKRR